MNQNERKQHEQADPEAAAQYAELLEAARSLKRMYEALIEEGFTESQALILCGSTLGGQR